MVTSDGCVVVVKAEHNLVHVIAVRIVLIAALVDSSDLFMMEIILTLTFFSFFFDHADCSVLSDLMLLF